MEKLELFVNSLGIFPSVILMLFVLLMAYILIKAIFYFIKKAALNYVFFDSLNLFLEEFVFNGTDSVTNNSYKGKFFDRNVNGIFGKKEKFILKMLYAVLGVTVVVELAILFNPHFLWFLILIILPQITFIVIAFTMITLLFSCGFLGFHMALIWKIIYRTPFGF